MKTLLKILLPFFIAFGANAQSVYNIQGDTVKMSGFGAKPANLIMKNPFSYRRGGYLQIGTGNLTKWNYAIDSAYSLGGVLYLVRSTHDTIPIAISGTVGVSSVGAGFGTNFPNITTTGSVVVDSFTIATRLRVQKQIDSLATLIGSGGVTSVAAGFGTNFSTITTTGNIIVDSFTIATRLRVKKQIDSLSALLSSYVPVARTLTHSSGFGTTVTGGTQDMSANRTWSYLTDSTSGGLLSWVRGKKIADSLGVIIATKGSGSVTNVGSGFGTNFSAITTTGNVLVDSTSGGVLSWVRGKKISDSLGVLISAKGTGSVTSVGSGFGTSFSAITTTGSVVIDTTSGGVLSWVRGEKIADSLGVVIATKGSGTVTNVGSGFGTVFSAITTTGNVIIDSFTMATRARVQKPIDSLDAAIVAGYVPVTRTVAGFALSSNVTLASLTQGYGLAFSSGSTYNASTGITERIDTALISTVANRDKLKDSLGSVLGNYWNLSGNSLTAGSQTGSFIGAINNVSLRFRSNNVEVAKFDSTGSELYLENGLNPLISLKQKITAQEWQIRGNIGNGSSSQNFNIYDATNSKIAINISDYRHAAFGNVTSIPTSSQIYGFGGSLGANLDMRPDSLVNDDANIEVENAAYDDGSSPFLGFGLAMEHSGNKATGNTFVYSNKNLSQFRFTATNNIIRVINNASLRFGTNNTEYMVLDSNGRVGIGNKLPTYTLDVTGTSRITSTFYLSGNTYNSGAALVGLAIDTLTGIVYRKTASGSSGVTSVASGFGTSFSTITSTGTVVLDSTSGGVLSWIRGLKIKDSLIAWSNATFVPLTTTVNGKALSSNITLSLASADFANQGTTTTVLHGNAGGNPSFGAIVNADITNSTIDLTAKVTGILPSANGGTGNGFTKFSGAASSEKTYTLPNASATILTDNAAVTVAQGGTGLQTLTAHNMMVGNGTSNVTFLAPSTTGKIVFSNGTDFVMSTPTFPNASATTRKIIVSDGTNWVASTETYAVPGTSGNVLTSDGTNWTSAAPVVTASSTNTFTNKRWTQRVGSTTSSATPTINTDNVDVYKLTAQSADISNASTNLTGTPVDGDIFEIQITGTATRNITWGTAFVSSTVTLPSATSSTTTLTVIFQYFTVSSYGNNKWVCVNYF